MDSPAAEKPLIRIENVSYDYGYGLVLDRVSFPIHPGDFLAIIGPNGAGKTTLLKIILGLLTPRSGQVWIMGRPLKQFTEWDRLGYVPQKATHIDPFFPVSVREVVAMGALSERRLPRLGPSQEARILEALRHVGMESYKNRRIGSLSAGQQQRVFIARAVVHNPKVLFLDEPTTGVDAQAQSQFYEMLHRLNEDAGITIVLVTHEIGLLNRHVKQVACLNQRLVYHGSHDEFCQSKEFKMMLAEGDHVISHRH